MKRTIQDEIDDIDMFLAPYGATVVVDALVQKYKSFKNDYRYHYLSLDKKEKIQRVLEILEHSLQEIASNENQDYFAVKLSESQRYLNDWKDEKLDQEVSSFEEFDIFKKE